MVRYLKLYFTCIKRSIITRLEYKRDTFLSIFNFILTNVASILSIWMITESIPSLEGWTMEEMGTLYGFSMLPVAIDHIFTDDLWNVAYWKVRSGEMDRMFTKPVPVLFQVIAETFQLEGLGELIVGVVMLSVCGSMLNVTWTFGAIFVLIIATVFGALVITSFKIIFASLAFKFKRSGPLLQVNYNFISYTRYPIKIYPAAIRAMLTFIFPFALIISYPVEIFLVQTYSPYAIAAIIVGVSIALFALSIVIWNALAKRYESTGS